MLSQCIMLYIFFFPLFKRVSCLVNQIAFLKHFISHELFLVSRYQRPSLAFVAKYWQENNFNGVIFSVAHCKTSDISRMQYRKWNALCHVHSNLLYQCLLRDTSSLNKWALSYYLCHQPKESWHCSQSLFISTAKGSSCSFKEFATCGSPQTVLNWDVVKVQISGSPQTVLKSDVRKVQISVSPETVLKSDVSDWKVQITGYCKTKIFGSQAFGPQAYILLNNR